ncbi:radical SAM protein [Allokutzneria albata]|uniref:Radical SAM superfamily protein n=1 Tax=Allokutzneria albata TaxID=211114 RepID=A0A1G9R6Q8_ALLAB|nr:radical SAM protein [Allokutzneria albata]SDM18956.1 Radical SAM superfamily protein [Allokutzneria albata]
MATAPTRFRHGRLYITFRCNARCGYCNVWQDPVFDGHQELTADGLRRCLDELAALGVSYVDITGGEPALHKEMVAAVTHAHSLGMAVDVTTNAIRFPQQAREIVPLVSTMNISLDTLDAQRYHDIRGTDTLERTIELVCALRSDGARNLKLICVVSGQNVDELDEVVAFARQQEVPVYLSPMFSYFSTQSEVRPAGSIKQLKLAAVNGRSAAPAAPVRTSVPSSVLIERVAEKRYDPSTVVSLAFLHHLRTMDPATVTACGANSRVLTIGPSGQVMLPCYHEWDGSIAWDRPYREIVNDPELIRVRDEEVGSRPGCRTCAVFPYLGLPMSYRFTTPFLVQAFSEELIKLKAFAGALTAEHRQRLLERSETLLADIEARTASMRPGTHLDELYHFEAVGGLVRTDFGVISVAELLADHSHDDCWRVHRSPHRLVRLLYSEILPALDGSSLCAEALDVQIDCWEAMWLRDAEAADRLASWCSRVLDVLPGNRAVGLLALFSSLPVAEIPSVAGHAEELLVRKLLSPARRAEAASLFSPLELSRVDSDEPVPTPEEARAGAHLARFVAELCCADTTALRHAVRRWKLAHDPEIPVERHLLELELAE